MSEANASPETRTEAAEELADRYLVLWNEPDADRRRRTITELWTEDGRHILQPPQEIRGIAARPGIGLAAILEARGYEETEARGASAYEHWVGSEGSASGGATTPSPHHAAKRLFVACDRKELRWHIAIPPR